MVVLRSLRQSPAYLYAKAYCLCALVSLFKSTPLTSGLSRVKHNLPFDHDRHLVTRRAHVKQAEAGPSQAVVDALTSSASERGSPSYVGRITRRWYQRAVDLAQIKPLLRRDAIDVKVYPEVKWNAAVRCSSALHPEETKFIQLRKQRISSKGQNSLHKFLNLPLGEVVDPRDVPLVALGGSGGGYRAMYGFGAFISAAKKLHLWDCITWAAGVSGSCWTLGAYYTIAGHNISRLMQHYLSVAKELAHPMSLHALNTIARTSKGVYFLIGPLVRKAQSNIIGIGIMDLYATLITTYQFLSRAPGKRRLSRATFQFSRVWHRSCAGTGAEPMPILTAVRRAPKESYGVKPNRDSSISKGQPPESSLTQHDTRYLVPHPARLEKAKDFVKDPRTNDLFQWFEVSPLEVGSADIQRYIPTWSWGRTFVCGHSVDRKPEQPLSLILGQCTSAPAGPLTGYMSALLATLPKGTFMSRILFALNKFIRLKRWERLWANPIRAGHEPNPFYGLGLLPSANRPKREREETGAHDEITQKSNLIHPGGKFHEAENEHSWESQGRVRLMDGGMSNNLPNHILSRPERCADMLIAFDASSDVQASSAIQRIQNFADDCEITLYDESMEFEHATPRHQPTGDGGEEASAYQTESKYLRHYARVFRGNRKTGENIYLVYCPLLPNAVNPHFNPSTAPFSTSYNLVWTPEQVQCLLTTSESNLTNYAIGTIRKVMRKIYEHKKSQRLRSGSDRNQIENRNLGTGSRANTGN